MCLKESTFCIAKIAIWSLYVCMTVGFPSTMAAFFGVRKEFGNGSLEILDAELAKAVHKPNRWGYTIRMQPDVFNDELTYWLDGLFILNSVRFESVEDAERLLVEIYKDHLRNMNSIRIIRPFLGSFPLTPDTCWLGLGFDDANGNNVCPPYISSVSLDKGSVRCSLFVDKKGAPPIPSKNQKGITAVPFERISNHSARDIPGLKELYDVKVPRSSVDPKPTVPEFDGECWKFKNEFSKSQLVFLRNFCKKTSLYITVLGCVGAHYFDSRPLNFALHGFQRINLDEAKALAAHCCKAMAAFAQTTKVYQEYLKDRSTWTKTKYPSPTPVPEHYAFRITFWDENVDRPLAPYIAEIRLLDGKLSYFTADENQWLVLTGEETFANALGEERANSQQNPLP